MPPAGPGSSSGAEPTPENGLPIRIIVKAPAARPASPKRAFSPAITEAMASTVRLRPAALASQSPSTTSSQLPTMRRRQAHGAGVMLRRAWGVPSG
jgi:hypothetical protein